MPTVERFSCAGESSRPSGRVHRRRVGDAPVAGITEHMFRAYPRRRTACRQLATELSSRKHPLAAGSSSRSSTACGEPWGRRYREVPVTTSGRRSRARPIAPELVEVEPVLAEPRLPAAVRVPVGDDEAPPPAARRRPYPGVVSRVVRRRLAQGHPDRRRDPRLRERAHDAIDVVHGRPVVVPDVDHDDRAERPFVRCDHLERRRGRSSLEDTARRDESPAGDGLRAQVQSLPQVPLRGGT